MALELDKNIVEELVRDRYGIRAEAFPVGHHHLKRHYVFRLETNDRQSLVFKAYYRKDRYFYETMGIKLLKNIAICTPKIIHYGTLGDGVPYVLMECIDGAVLEGIKYDMTYEEEMDILFQMGESLSRIHGRGNFRFFGKWEDRKSLCSTTYKGFLSKKCEGIFASLRRHNLPERDIIERGISLLESRFDLLDDVTESVLCHNDFDYRNIIVCSENGALRLKGVIDFEQCHPSDKLSDVIALYHKVLRHDKGKFYAFNEGYSSTGSDLTWDTEKVDFYMLYASLLICSFAHFAAKDYYGYGIELLRESIGD